MQSTKFCPQVGVDTHFPLCNNSISDHQKTTVSASIYLSENNVDGWFRVRSVSLISENYMMKNLWAI